MKRVLISNIEQGTIFDIAEPGKEFEIHPDFAWIDCNHDEVQTSWKWEIGLDGIITFKVHSILDDKGFQENGVNTARAIAYKSVGEQLGMIYDELKANGTLSFNGPWAKHITEVKATLPKGDLLKTLEWNQIHNAK